jgi:tetratricopeptide (TPR) repeat protein
VAEGLHHAHEQGVIHRDIKPQNLLLGPDDELHITDFGLARILDEPALTQSSELVGTPAYMAPEQITGGRAALDRRTDIYALGVTLYEMLTLQRPFCAETYDQTIHQILSREPPPPRRIDPHIPADLETICLRAMEKERQRRFATAAEMARDLRRWAEGFPINSRPLGPVGKAVRWVRRHPWRAAVIATTALLVILIPLAVSFFSAMASAEIDRALAVLLNDYREQDRALAELGWAGRIGGDRRRRDLVEAFASVRTDPRRSIEILEPAVAEHPDDPDLHYLLAWAYTRRIPTRGVEVWADAERQIALADALRREASAAGWFFRGQAVWGIDPEEAVRSLERAIKRADEEGFTFMQAMLHQGRAMNQIMYSWRALDPLRAISFYEKAVGRLEYAALGQQKRAYPRYLLALTHLLAAEIYRQGDEQGQQKAERLFDIALRTAQDAQRVEPSSPRGYAAEAQCYESRGKFAAETRSPQWRQDFDRAIGVWRQFDNSALDVHRATSDDSERFEYQMRLHFWLGQCAQAEQMRQSRYGPQTGYSRERCFDGDDSFLEALLAASDGEPSRAVQALAAGAQFAIQNPEYGLRLDAAYRLLGREPPPALLPREIPADCDLSPGWTPAWLATLIGYQRSELDWPAVEQAARAGTQHPDEARLRMAGAYFYRGIRELAAGRRPAALDAFKSSRDRYDNENYCFRAELLLVKLLTDPAWPSWLAADAPASP